MKKLFVCALAASMFTACSQDETISQQSPMQISFDGAFVENATRAADPSITTDNLADFDVWGFMNSTDGIVFNDEKVWKAGDVWTYATTQYWLPGKTYQFAAVAPSDKENEFIKVNTATADNTGLGVIDFENNDGTTDLLYAAAEAITMPETITEQPAPVKFIFNHLLSKVKFTFINGFTNENTTIKVSNIVMHAPKTGSIDLIGEWWKKETPWSTTDAENTLILNFGNEESETANNPLTLAATTEGASENYRFTIPTPVDFEYTVEFDVEMMQGEVSALKAHKTATIKGVELEIGKAYNFVAELNASNISETGSLYPITFAAEVKPWEEVGATTILNNVTVPANEELMLVADGTINGTLTVNGTLNGAGHTLTVAENPTNKFVVQPSGNAAIKNLTINGQNRKANDKSLYGIYISTSGKYTIADVNVTGVLYPLNASLSADKVVTLNVVNSTLEGWTSFATTADATFENVSFTKNATTEYCNFKPYGNAVLKNCTFAEGAYLDLCALAEGKTITFINCNYNGTVITAANIATIFDTFEGKDGKFGVEGFETVKSQILFQ